MKLFILLAFFPLLFSAQTRPAPQHSEAEAKDIIDSLYIKLVVGADFASMAKQYSEDPGTKEKGGLIVNAKEGTFAPEFEAVVLQLKLMEISKPFKSPYGYHIAQVISRNGTSFSVRHILIGF